MVKNLVQLFLKRISQGENKIGFAQKTGGEWMDVSYGEFWKKVNFFSVGLLELGLQKGDKVALLSENRLEWPIADLATLSIGVVNVPIYSTYGAKKIEFFLLDSEARGIICSTETQLSKILELDLPQEHIKICMDLSGKKEGVLSFSDVMEKGEKAWPSRGEEVEKLRESIAEEDLATLIYTSGTTGDPKGVMMSHKNFVSNVVAVSQVLPFGQGDVALSFLPLSHSFERCAGYYLLVYQGAKICYAPSVATVLANMKEVKPTVMCSVPRLYEKMYAKITSAVEKSFFLSKKLFYWALQVGEAHRNRLAKGQKPGFLAGLKYSVAHNLVLSKILAQTGGRVRYFASGGAPLSPKIAQFFYGIGILILEGYGLSETSPMISCNTPSAFRFGSVGKVLPGLEVKIGEDGEILVRGDSVMSGYFKREEATREVIEPDGWFHTGDIGSLDEEGFLTIEDRKKDLIITAGGKNIAPQYLENLLKTDPFIDECVVIGDRRKYLSALVVPNFDNLKLYCREGGLSLSEPLVENKEIYDMMEKRIQSLLQNLASFEAIQKFTLLDQSFSEASGELTPTLKIRRKEVVQKFTPIIERMYGE